VLEVAGAFETGHFGAVGTALVFVC
jgi:hypothetical protein